MDLTRRQWLGGAIASGVFPEFRATAASGPITPERFGAVGDGQTNDTAAFARMAAFVNRQGWGEISLRPTTYVVGQQTAIRKSTYAYEPAPILNIIGCSGAITIRGNGARLRCADGLRYGTFDPRTGQATQHPLPYLGSGELASPYQAMINIENCSGPIDISDLELDGNLAGLLIGGPYGDTGWQIPASGMRFLNNSGSQRISRVSTHHHALDGLYIDSPEGRQSSSYFENVECDYNARQGCSIVGGPNYQFANCGFRHTGKAGLVSAPGAGVDIEAEVRAIRNVRFSGCEFSDNSGPGILADSGDSEGAIFEGCRFIGTTCWSAWPRKPLFRFHSCEFVGSVCNAFGDVDQSRAAQFHDCQFNDDPTLSPTRRVYDGGFPIADLSDSRNVLFNQCQIKLSDSHVLPWSVLALYNDCTMSQVSQKQAYPRGTYTGTNTIEGNVDLYSSTILGVLTVNGQAVPQTPHVGM